MKIKKAQWAATASKIMSCGYSYAGTCGCSANARKYRKNSYPAISIRIFPNIAKVKLYLNNQSQTPHEEFTQIDAVLDMAAKTEMAARQQRKNS